MTLSDGTPLSGLEQDRIIREHGPVITKLVIDTQKDHDDIIIIRNDLKHVVGDVSDIEKKLDTIDSKIDSIFDKLDDLKLCMATSTGQWSTLKALVPIIIIGLATFVGGWLVKTFL